MLIAIAVIVASMWSKRKVNLRNQEWKLILIVAIQVILMWSEQVMDSDTMNLHIFYLYRL